MEDLTRSRQASDDDVKPKKRRWFLWRLIKLVIWVGKLIVYLLELLRD